MKLYLLSFFFCFINFANLKAQYQIHSPDGSVQLTVDLESNGSLSYEVYSSKNGMNTRLIQSSELGITRNDCDFYTGLTLNSIDSTSENQTYQLHSGKKKSHQFESRTITFHTSKCGVNFDILFKVLNNGVAFRYFFPDNSTAEYHVASEHSEFKIDNTLGVAWMQENFNSYPVYEGFFDEMAVGASSTQASGFVFPALMTVNNHWLMLTETDLDSNFYASHLSQHASGGNYQISGPYPFDGVTQFDQFARFSTPMQTPWRVIIIGKELNEIVESDVTTDLARPSVLIDDSYIESGIATFSWWSSFTSSSYIDSMVHYVDLASDLNCPFFTIDADWDKIQDLQTALPQFVDFATSKGVKLWTWYNMGGPHNANSYANNITPRDSMHITQTRRNHLQWIKDMGIVGIKVDFMMSDKQGMIKHYIDILNDAADVGLMVNFHGATTPRGWQRTYPNLMTMEAVAGGEGILFNNEFRNRLASHNVTLAFTRNVLGSMDYTPGVLGHTYHTNGSSLDHNSSISHQLALLTLFESGQSHFADHYTRYNNLPLIAKDIIRQIPGAWDETKLLSGYPDEDVVLARRDHHNWFISGINGENSTKSQSINLDFLPDGKYKLRVIKDGTDKTQITTSIENYTTGNNLNIELIPYGGFTLFFEASCLDQISLSEEVSVDIQENYQAKKLNSSQKISQNASLNLLAEEAILLEPNFNSETGSTFKAEIGTCAD
ncbi:glycoside hydrolase family 97 catalytic domain-containing protein [Jiulongibacter sp. NS-SX5]|uniref:glycoside hydrolase family 97 catalytic domain-containing protein n=1 Tax=Jiulongibacter sp. NS-SX5 TaxID=3463854 RepID=UPI0040595D9C